MTRIRLFLGFTIAAWFCLCGTRKVQIETLDFISQKFAPFYGKSGREL